MRRPLILAVIALALTACGSNERTGDGTSGIDGIAYLGPQCPVVTEDSPCPDVPYPDGRIQVKDRATGEVVTTVTTDADGRFRVELEPGDYVLEGVPPEGKPLPFAKPVDVTVTAGEFVEVVVSFDTGIR